MTEGFYQMLLIDFQLLIATLRTLEALRGGQTRRSPCHPRWFAGNLGLRSLSTKSTADDCETDRRRET